MRTELQALIQKGITKAEEEHENEFQDGNTI
jgi:hypothetical protein